MITIIAKYTIILFGLFFIFIGFLMFFNPKKARSILRKAGSTNLINYGEITIRMIPATALIIYANLSKFPESIQNFRVVHANYFIGFIFRSKTPPSQFFQQSSRCIKTIVFSIHFAFFYYYWNSNHLQCSMIIYWLSYNFK